MARRRSGNQLLLSSGGSAEVAGEPPQYEFMVVLDAEDRKEKALPLVRMMARIEPEWLIDLFPHRVREKSEAIWNRAAERVEVVNALLYDELVIQETKGAAPDRDAAAALLAQKALEAGIERFVDFDLLNEFMARVEFAGLPPPDVAQSLHKLCAGLRSFAELKNAAADFVTSLEQNMASHRLNGSHLACRTSSACAKHRGSGCNAYPWWCTCLPRTSGPCRQPRTSLDFGSDFIRRCAAN